MTKSNGQTMKKTKKKTGRKLIIPTPEEMDKRVDAYFARCKEEGEPPTRSGMVLAMGLKSKEQFYDYAKRPKFRESVARAKMLIENVYERRMHSTTPTGAIFALKNMGWSDRQEVTHDGSVSVNITRFSDKPTKQAKAAS